MFRQFKIVLALTGIVVAMFQSSRGCKKEILYDGELETEQPYIGERLVQ